MLDKCDKVIKQALKKWRVHVPVLKAIKKATCGLPPHVPVKKKTTVIIVDDKKDDKDKKKKKKKKDTEKESSNK